MASSLEVHTLESVATYLAGDLFESSVADTRKLLIQVKSPDAVALMHELTNDTRQRETLLSANRYGDKFPFGSYMPQEDFVIALQSNFVDTSERSKLLQVAGNIADELIKTAVDDGVTQEVTAKAGIGRLVEMDLPNPVSLRPHRTFPEVEQPESSFVFRMKRTQNGPAFALFGADNELWKLEAIKNIKAWLEEKVTRENIIILG